MENEIKRIKQKNNNDKIDQYINTNVIDNNSNNAIENEGDQYPVSKYSDESNTDDDDEEEDDDEDDNEQTGNQVKMMMTSPPVSQSSKSQGMKSTNSKTKLNSAIASSISVTDVGDLEIMTEEWKYQDNDYYNFDYILGVKEQRKIGTPISGRNATPQAPSMLVRAKGALIPSIAAIKASLIDYGPASDAKMRLINPNNINGTPLVEVRHGVDIECVDNIALFGDKVYPGGWRYARLQLHISRGARVKCKKSHVALKLEVIDASDLTELLSSSSSSASASPRHEVEEYESGKEMNKHVSPTPPNATISSSSSSSAPISLKSLWVRTARLSISEKAMCPRTSVKRKRSSNKKQGANTNIIITEGEKADFLKSDIASSLSSKPLLSGDKRARRYSMATTSTSSYQEPNDSPHSVNRENEEIQHRGGATKRQQQHQQNSPTKVEQSGNEGKKKETSTTSKLINAGNAASVGIAQQSIPLLQGQPPMDNVYSPLMLASGSSSSLSSSIPITDPLLLPHSSPMTLLSEQGSSALNQISVQSIYPHVGRDVMSNLSIPLNSMNASLPRTLIAPNASGYISLSDQANLINQNQQLLGAIAQLQTENLMQQMYQPSSLINRRYTFDVPNSLGMSSIDASSLMNQARMQAASLNMPNILPGGMLIDVNDPNAIANAMQMQDLSGLNALMLANARRQSSLSAPSVFHPSSGSSNSSRVSGSSSSSTGSDFSDWVKNQKQ